MRFGQKGEKTCLLEHLLTNLDLQKSQFEHFGSDLVVFGFSGRGKFFPLSDQSAWASSFSGLDANLSHNLRGLSDNQASSLGNSNLSLDLSERSLDSLDSQSQSLDKQLRSLLDFLLHDSLSDSSESLGHSDDDLLDSQTEDSSSDNELLDDLLGLLGDFLGGLLGDNSDLLQGNLDLSDVPM